MLSRKDPSVSSSVLSKAFFPRLCWRTWCLPPLALSSQERTEPLTGSQELRSHLSAQTCLHHCRPGPGEEGESGGTVAPAPEMRPALQLATRTPARSPIGHRRRLERWLSIGTPQTEGGPGSDSVSGEPEARPQPAMAWQLRASYLLSLLLAGFVPPSQGQEMSKVSEPLG